jgi:protein MpaA
MGRTLMGRARTGRARTVRAAAATALAVVLAVPAAAVPADRPAVVETRVIGHSLQDRPIRAWRLGEAGAERKVVLLAVMHGSERAPARILRTLRDGPALEGVDLWVVPVLNPDGARVGRRTNARGVDLNRNFPNRWKPQPHRYNAGARPASEPETRATMRFLDQIDPELVLSFHQPFRAIDTTRVKRPLLARAIAEALNLPLRRIDCNGSCHGTLTGWFNTTHDGMALTIELGPRPNERYLTRPAPRALADVLT